MVEGDPSVCGHVICTTASGGSNRQSINYSTERVVGNGSFGVVFQATCLETGETVSASDPLSYHLLLVFFCSGPKNSRDTGPGEACLTTSETPAY